MKEFLEPLQKDALFGDEGEDGGVDGSNNALMSFGSEALARAISDRGGFGIAKKIIDQLATANGQPPVPFQNGQRFGKNLAQGVLGSADGEK